MPEPLLKRVQGKGLIGHRAKALYQKGLAVKVANSLESFYTPPQT